MLQKFPMLRYKYIHLFLHNSFHLWSCLERPFQSRDQNHEHLCNLFSGFTVLEFHSLIHLDCVLLCRVRWRYSCCSLPSLLQFPQHHWREVNFLSRGFRHCLSPLRDPASLQRYFPWRVIECSALTKASTFSWGHRNQSSTINNLKQLLGSGKK